MTTEFWIYFFLFFFLFSPTDIHIDFVCIWQYGWLLFMRIPFVKFVSVMFLCVCFEAVCDLHLDKFIFSFHFTLHKWCTDTINESYFLILNESMNSKRKLCFMHGHASITNRNMWMSTRCWSQLVTYVTSSSNTVSLFAIHIDTRLLAGISMQKSNWSDVLK